jgi:PPOX class probable F420-dependent enzyme
MATADGEGRPHLVPVSFGYNGDGAVETVCYAVDWKPKKTRRLKRLANIEVNPAVSVLVDEYSVDWTQLWWVRVDGLARVVDDGPAFDAAIALLRDKYEQYRRLPPAGPVVLIDVTGWSSWSAS